MLDNPLYWQDFNTQNKRTESSEFTKNFISFELFYSIRPWATTGHVWLCLVVEALTCSVVAQVCRYSIVHHPNLYIFSVLLVFLNPRMKNLMVILTQNGPNGCIKHAVLVVLVEVVCYQTKVICLKLEPVLWTPS